MRNLVVASLVLASTQVAIADPVSFPADYPFQTVQGLTVDDDPKGALVVTGNKFCQTGSHITVVNDQKVTTAREAYLLISSAKSSGGRLQLTCASQDPAKKSDEPVIPAKTWAQALAFSDSPQGVVIEYSPKPEQIGGIFEKFNGEPVVSAEDLKAKLDRFIATPSSDWSTSIVHYGDQPSPEALRADAITVALPAIAYTSPPDGGRILFLARAVQNEPSRPTAAETELYASIWGPLAWLAGKLFIGDIFDETCQKASSGNSCYSMIWWQRPGQVLVRAWYADRGYLVAADTILPTGKPGLFMVHRWDPVDGAPTSGRTVGAHFLRVTKTMLAEKGAKFRYVNSPVTSAMPSDEPTVFSLTQADPGRYRSVSSYSRTAALQNSQELRASIQRAIDSDREAQRQRERDQSISAAYGALVGIGQALDSQYQMERQAFDQQLQQMQSPQSNSGRSSSGRAIIMNSLSNSMDGTAPEKPIPQASNVQPPASAGLNTFTQGQSGSTCPYWHRNRAGDGEYEQCSPGDENCTCGDAVKVSPQ